MSASNEGSERAEVIYIDIHREEIIHIKEEKQTMRPLFPKETAVKDITPKWLKGAARAKGKEKVS
ncbi:hypothetical protein DD606_26265 [Enterobacter cloacae complex sp. GF14B]|nr:hypothetical protein DD606_26265 [Enterobacter cloacae complex sp. GF14B]